MSDPSVQPLDMFVMEGFAQRFQQVFGCAKCAFINQNDKTKVLDALFGQGKTLTYPYAYFVIQTTSVNNESYNPHQWVRRGIRIGVRSDDTIQMARIQPTNFDIEVTYVTNKFDSIEQGSVRAFVRRWLLARRAGYLKFSVDYGLKQFGIGLTLAESINIPQRENIVEQETKYEITVLATIHGYISEPYTAKMGKTNQINVNAQIGGVNSQIVSSQFFAFPTEEQ